MIEVEDKQFTLFWDIDRDVLASLPFSGRVAWLRERINETLLKPLAVLEEAHQSAFVWLAVTELVCSGIESLGGFYGNNMHGTGTPFCRFVYRFMHSDYSQRTPDKFGKDITYCEHLQSYFRNGLSHGFAIEWGGLWKADEPSFGGGYLRQNKDGKGIAVCPEKLLEDFRRAVDAYFRQLLADGERSLIGKNFMRRFEAVRQQRSKVY